MSRIATTFEKLGASGRKALIPYVCAGDPFADGTVDLMHALAAGGADVIELGVPFSDPMADGPVIQKAAERALAKGIGMVQVLDMVRAFRQKDHHARGADGLRQPGGALRPEARRRRLREGCRGGRRGRRADRGLSARGMREFAAKLKAHGLDLIFLLAPTSTEARMAQVGRSPPAMSTTSRSRA
jgi:tryptophan synthase alpha chain